VTLAGSYCPRQPLSITTLNLPVWQRITSFRPLHHEAFGHPRPRSSPSASEYASETTVQLEHQVVEPVDTLRSLP